MKPFAKEHGFSSPHVVDETQVVARAYEAVCTPEFFGFNAALELQYQGRLDAPRTGWKPIVLDNHAERSLHKRHG